MANNPKKYASDSTLSAIVAKIKELFVKKTDLNTELAKKANSSHTHSISDTTNLQSTLDGKVPTSRTVNGKALTTNITLSASDVGASSSSHTHDDRYYTETEMDSKLAGKSDTTHNHDSKYDSKGSASAVQENLDVVSDTLDDHTTNSDIHVTTTNKSNWNAAHTHSTSAHARADATKVADSTTNGNILINGTETNVYSHPNSGVSAGTYKSVTVNAQGHITSGSNPTTLSGYGITDAETKGTVNTHNTSTSAHNDIRALITDLTTKLNNFLDVDDTTTDQLSEVLTLIENNKGTLESLTTSKVNVSDIVNNLTTNSSSKVLSAAQGVAIKALIDALQTEVDTKVTAVSGKGLSTNDYTTIEKNKLSGIASGAQVNQNAFSNIAVSGQTTVAADTTTDTLTLAGSNVTITTDATNDKVTFAVADGSTSTKGVVQLTNSTSSTSTTTAATPNSVKTAYDLANTAKTRADSAYSLAESKVDSLSDLGVTATATELNYMDGVTSNVQAQLDSKKSLRTSRFTVGTSASGWTTSDCDYLCDGTADQIEINAAIAALPTSGGEIVILDGTYNLSGAIVLSGTHITLQGSNGATKLVRAFKGSSSAMGIIVVTGSYCTVQGLSIDGVDSDYTGFYHSGIYVSGGHNNFIENEITNNYTSGIYISSASGSYNMIHGNKCNNNTGYGIYINSTNICNTISDNTCDSNDSIGIYVGNNGKNTITGNICITNSNHGIGLYTDDSAVSGNVCNENTGSGLYSSNGTNNGIAGNTFNANGAYGIQMGSSTSGNSLAGNSCESNTSGDISDSGNNIRVLPLSGGTLTGTLNVPRIYTDSTSATLGSADSPFQQVYAQSIYIHDGTNYTKSYGSFRKVTEGTTSTTGQTRLDLGNGTNTGTAGNAQGIIRLYGTGTSYHQIQGAPTSNRTLTLPNKTGTLATTDDVTTAAVMTTAEYTALEESEAINANTLYMLTDAEEETPTQVQIITWEEND